MLKCYLTSCHSCSLGCVTLFMLFLSICTALFNIYIDLRSNAVNVMFGNILFHFIFLTSLLCCSNDYCWFKSIKLLCYVLLVTCVALGLFSVSDCCAFCALGIFVAAAFIRDVKLIKITQFQVTRNANATKWYKQNMRQNSVIT